ncbi:MAG: hypothetical protein GWN14_18380 [candidate division Zixibacteria bacterium]|nr:hypothetical protein [candidate division Zixibacteria bacterium]
MIKISILAYIFLFFFCATVISWTVWIDSNPPWTSLIKPNYIGYMGSKYSLHRAAGLLQYADKNNIRVIMANGRVCLNSKSHFIPGIGDEAIQHQELINGLKLWR